uniref:Uncharacterized protein n=1 Tax=Zea mays TaxID=4577 RepID=C4J0B6_MAIZE|nr:unknown [Zea mays]
MSLQITDQYLHILAWFNPSAIYSFTIPCKLQINISACTNMVP